MKASEPAEVAI